MEQIKRRINEIDSQLAALFAERMALTDKLADTAREQKLPVVNTAEERETVNRLTDGHTESMAGYIKVLYKTIFDLTRAGQEKRINTTSRVSAYISDALKSTPHLFPKSAVVACQGTEGANSTQACEKLFERPSILYFNTFDGVMAAVDKGLCQYGILPIENSLHGSVTGNYDLLREYGFYIVNSTKLKINHVLLAQPEVKLSDVKKIYSHEQALGQCSEFLKSLNIEIEPCENTATAAKMIAESGRTDAAAISSIQCAELYNLAVLKEGIQNSDNNYTRFICLSKRLEIYPGARKISLLMTLPHRPGSLYRLMAKFATLGINLTKLESHPLPDKDFEFMFYFDLDVSVYDQAVFDLFAQLESGNEKFMFMGCYIES
jgi:chorismate mutase/prephenate dehydratase